MLRKTRRIYESKEIYNTARKRCLAASMLVGCGGINKNETVATLDGQEIKLGVANFAARLQQAEADDFYRAYFGDDVWSSDLYNNGTTMEDNTKNSVIEMIENLYILQNHMADYDVTLTDDETAKIAEVAAGLWQTMMIKQSMHSEQQKIL